MVIKLVRRYIFTQCCFCLTAHTVWTQMFKVPMIQIKVRCWSTRSTAVGYMKNCWHGSKFFTSHNSFLLSPRCRSFASPSGASSFGALANQSAPPSFGGMAQQGPGFGAQPGGFAGFGQQPQPGGDHFFPPLLFASSCRTAFSHASSIIS